MAELEQLFHNINRLLDGLEQRALQEREEAATAPSASAELEPGAAAPPLCRWRAGSGRGRLEALPRVASITLDDLLCVERQKETLLRNTCQFRDGLPANNVLLWGPRGTGKSSLLQALASHLAGPELRFVELDKRDLGDLRELFELIEQGPRGIVFCDDLSFDDHAPEMSALKTALEGSLHGRPEGSLLYVTSNRRHLVPEFMQENRAGHLDEHGELHLVEAAEERLALAERFGLALAFHPFKREEYLRIAAHWLRRLGAEQGPDQEAEVRRAALRWALAKGSRSGRSAYQFACDQAGRVRRES